MTLELANHMTTIPECTSRLETVIREARVLLDNMEQLIKAEGGRAFSLSPEKRRRVDTIIQFVSLDYNVSPLSIYSPARGNAVVSLARHIAITLIRAKLGLSTYQTGDIFKRDHSTISHAEECVNDRIATDSKFAAQFARINAEIETKLKSL